MVLVYHNKLTLQQNLVLTFFLLYHLVKLDMFRNSIILVLSCSGLQLSESLFLFKTFKFHHLTLQP